jgi:hypothetical protein
MADIQLKTFEKQRFYKIDDTLARILFSLGVAEGITKEPAQTREDTPPPKVPTFSVVMGPQGSPVLQLHLPSGERRFFNNEIAMRFDANTQRKQWAEAVRNAFKTLVWSGAEGRQVLQGPEPSEEVIEEYRNTRNKLAAAANEAHRVKMENAAILSR